MKLNLLSFLAILFLTVIFITQNSCTKTTTNVKPPTVVFTVLPNYGTTETNFVFDATETVDGLGNSTDLLFRWDFENDGVWDTDWLASKTQTHKYDEDGYYNVGLQVEDSYSYLGWTSRNLLVGDGGTTGPGYPTAIFTVSPQEGNLGTEFQFDASAVSDEETSTEDLVVRWDFNGDGNWDTEYSNTKTGSYQYDTEGTYVPKMQVKDLDGNVSSTTKTVTVSVFVIIDYANVGGGSFTMGCTDDQGSACEDDEFPNHLVTLESFSISKYEVTNEEFAIFLNSVGCSADGTLNGEKYIHIESDTCQIKYNSEFYAEADNENHPVIYVTWFGAAAFCEWIGGRLPTEAEWEFAARGGNLSNGYRYSGSNTINTVAWFSDNSDLRNHNIGGKTPNELGIYDMSGNVREWCSDWYDYFYYQTSPASNPQGPSEGIYRVLRGGSFWVQAGDCRNADRYWGFPEDTFYKYEVGFRVAKD